MKISHRTIQALGRVITGDGNMSPYRSGPKLVDFFNKHGGNAFYGKGFPSRWDFAEQQLRALNGRDSIKAIIEEAVDPREYLNTAFEAGPVVDHLNEYLLYDGFQIINAGLLNKVIASNGQASPSSPSTSLSEHLDAKKGSHAFILEQIDKCRDKLDKSDFDGAITNARSMVEAVFEDILETTTGEIPDHKGNLERMYKDVKSQLNLDDNATDLSETLVQTLRGLTTIVGGLAGISNKMGDRHSRKYKPEKHHAMLAVNASYALCEFLISSMKYQHQKGKKDA